MATTKIQSIETAVIEELFAEFNEGLRVHGEPNFDLLQRCPEPYRKELRSLMNVAALTYRALRPERDAKHRAREAQAAV